MLHVVIGGIKNVGITHVQLVDFILAVSTFSEDLDIVAFAVDGHITSHSKGLEDGTFITGDGEGVGPFNLSHNGDLVIVDEDIDGVVGAFLDIGGDFLFDGLIGLGNSEAGELDLADNGKVDFTSVVNEVVVYLATDSGHPDA